MNANKLINLPKEDFKHCIQGGDSLTFDNRFFSGKTLSKQDILNIADYLQEHPEIKTLTLASIGIQPEACELLGSVLANKSLTELQILSMSIGDEGAKAIAKGLAANKTLQILNLDGNEIGDDGAKAIFKEIGIRTYLADLSITNNKIGDESVKTIVGALKANETLEKLCLKGNKFTDEGIEALSSFYAEVPREVAIDIIKPKVSSLQALSFQAVKKAYVEKKKKNEKEDVKKIEEDLKKIENVIETSYRKK